MRHLSVYIEINGEQIRVGSIDGRIPEDAVFSYDESYLEGDAAAPISINLPLQKESFSSAKTRNFFDGLLPEGYTRRCAAEFMKIDENDYLSMLAGLGSECIGAVMVIEGNCLPSEPAYVKLSSEEMRTLAAEGAAESVQIFSWNRVSIMFLVSGRGYSKLPVSALFKEYDQASFYYKSQSKCAGGWACFARTCTSTLETLTSMSK